MAGLAAAHDLNKAGHEVTVYEAAPEVGGLAAGFKAPDWDWTLEKFYHHWFAGDKDMLGLIDELGWSDKVIFRRPWTVVYYKDKFQAARLLRRSVQVYAAQLRPGRPGALRPGRRLPQADVELEALETRDGGLVAAQVGRAAGLQRHLAADARGQVRRAEPRRGERGVVLGARQGPHDPSSAPLPAASRRFLDALADNLRGPGCRDPSEHADHRHPQAGRRPAGRNGERRRRRTTRSSRRVRRR